ncbi:hypothetical protein BDV95DRAFT_514288 [Massariosphaeria phaeospora]|uniref:Uncharacterized protein n=1 Tax=Massariosphaeria phaeospora TaxID=100035 RepID=A0A7C8IC29_9PLEO|nr:hypothetical protein BDV95DRAFT_514288 [Massariosphaeria phaeospora]
MAQGAIKKSSKPSAKKTPTHLPKRGSRIIKPKKTSLITQNQIKKKSTSGLNAQTEKMLAEKAGHLELLKGGKKDRLKSEVAKGKKEGKVAG